MYLTIFFTSISSQKKKKKMKYVSPMSACEEGYNGKNIHHPLKFAHLEEGNKFNLSFKSTLCLSYKSAYKNIN